MEGKRERVRPEAPARALLASARQKPSLRHYFRFQHFQARSGGGALHRKLTICHFTSTFRGRDPLSRPIYPSVPGLPLYSGEKLESLSGDAFVDKAGLGLQRLNESAIISTLPLRRV